VPIIIPAKNAPNTMLTFRILAIAAKKKHMNKAYPNTEDFINALNAASFGGYTDWRMPTVKELSYIASNNTSNPCINTAYFHNTQTFFYWTSTTYAGNHDYVRSVFFNYFFSGSRAKSESNRVRAVRGQSASSYDFIDNGDGTVKDNNTGLTWQQLSAGVMSWEEALSYAENSSLGGHSNWRLPNINELLTLLNYDNYPMTLNAEYFPGFEASSYWTSTSNYTGGKAWKTNFAYGWVYADWKDITKNYVLAVKKALW